MEQEEPIEWAVRKEREVERELQNKYPRDLNDPMKNAIADYKMARDRQFLEIIDTCLGEEVSFNLKAKLLQFFNQVADAQTNNIYKEWLSLDLRASRTKEQWDEELNRFAKFINNLR